MFKKLLLVMVVVGSACAMAPAAPQAAPQDAPAQPGFFRKGADGAVYYLSTTLTKVDGLTGISAVASTDEWTRSYLKNTAKVVVCAVLIYGAYKLLTHKKETPSEPTQTIVNDAGATA